MTALADVAAASHDVGATSSRRAKATRLVELLARTDADDVAVVVSWLSGELRQRQIGVGWAALRTLPAAADVTSLTVADVDARFDAVKAVAGTGSKARRADALAALFGAATGSEQDFLRRLLTGELRRGALLGVMTDALARATGIDVAQVRRAAMVRGDLPAVAAAAVRDGAPALAAMRLQVLRPVGPMLARPATTVGEALTELGGTAVLDAKLDGARVQVHRDGDDVAIFTRTLDDVTARLPEIAAAARALPVRSMVADGEAIALHADGRPRPFAVTASRFGSRRPAAGGPTLSVFFFDLLALDGRDLLDAPTTERLALLDAVVPAAARVARLVTDDPERAQRFYEDTLAAGHEGVMAKAPAAGYEAGRRGVGWLKVKRVHTLDLVVLAVEQGSGRRRGWLSTIHLGARDPATGGFVMLGKTFKGMTDAMLDWQTRRFTELADGGGDGFVVTVRPEQVVEVTFDGVVASSRYPAGMALRFARVVRYRDDKRAADADTVDSVRAVFDR